jgi:hypothetical protein
VKTLAVAVCNNGLGHIKRVLHVAKLLRGSSLRDLRIEVFVDVGKLRHFPALVASLSEGPGPVGFHDVKSEGAAYECELRSQYGNYLRESDYVWSDNLVFPLSSRPDTFLTGSFLWLEVRPDEDESRREEETLRRVRPIMIANKYFSTPAVRNLTDCRGVGMYEYSPLRIPEDPPPGLLVSCGRSRTARALFEAGLARLNEAVEKIPAGVDVFLEPEFADRFPRRANIVPADFSERMFSRVSAAAVRPGMGTISDVLPRGGRIFAFHEDANFEVGHNAAVLEDLRIGEDCRTADTAVARAAQYLAEPARRSEHVGALRRLDFDGLRRTSQEIQEIIH